MTTRPHNALAARRLAVVVPAFNADETLSACLGAISASSRPPDEIILFDDGSTDATQEIARAHGARIIANPGAPKGPAHGRNEGARATNAAIILFVDADVILERDAIAILESELQKDSEISAVFGSYNRAPPVKRIAGLYANLRHHYIHQNGARDAATFWTGIGAVRAAAFTAAGGFDERFTAPSMEDIEFGARLRAIGGRIRIAPGAQGAHAKDWTLAQLWATDIFRRAIPWARLIASGDGDHGHLNAGPRERIAALFAHLVWMLALGAFIQPGLGFGSLAALAVYLWLNRKLFALFAEVGGLRLLLAGAALHWLYHLYASAIFAVVAIAVRARLIPPRARERAGAENAS